MPQATKNRIKIKAATPVLISPKDRLAALRQIRGMWKNRKPDPIKELEKIRKEWDRELP